MVVEEEKATSDIKGPSEANPNPNPNSSDLKGPSDSTNPSPNPNPNSGDLKGVPEASTNPHMINRSEDAYMLCYVRKSALKDSVSGARQDPSESVMVGNSVSARARARGSISFRVRVTVKDGVSGARQDPSEAVTVGNIG
jgi:hypothetical protein